MLKKMYAIAIVRFLLTAVFVKDRPDLPQSGKVEILSENFAAEKIPYETGSVEGRDYYRAVKTINLNFDKIYTSAYIEAVIGIKPDEKGENKAVSVEEYMIYGGPSGYELEKIVDRSGLTDFYGFAYAYCRFTASETVSRIPIKKVLPGKFIKDVDFSGQMNYYSDGIDLKFLMYPEEVIRWANSADK